MAKDKDLPKNEYYCVFYDSEYADSQGFPRRKEDDNKVLAKKIYRTDGTIKHMIRIDTNKHLYNPINQINQRESRKPDSYKDNNQIKHITVGLKAFYLYTKYLIDLNPSWYNLAKREVN